MFIIKIMVASGGFDPPTLGLWALCASSAPTRLPILARLNYINYVFDQHCRTCGTLFVLSF